MPPSTGPSRPLRAVLVTTALCTFITAWRTAAVVGCDLCSTCYYIGGIVEASVGRAAPWYILAVLLFSYPVRTVYIESSAMFVRGGVYRVVKESMGGFMAKLSVSALMFDYLLTGPISGVSAGAYLVNLGLDALPHLNPGWAVADPGTRDAVKRYGAIPVAVLVTLFFYAQNRRGLRSSSLSAARIMTALIVLGVVLIVWCGVTLALDPAKRVLPPLAPDLSLKTEVDDATGEVQPKADPVTGRQQDPLGFLGGLGPAADPLRAPGGLLTLAGIIGIAVAFGHSILAMSGEETLAQVYREVAAPKLANFRRAAVTVFVISLTLTVGVSFLAVMIIPDDLRVSQYSDNLMSGLAMSVAGPAWAKLLLNAAVVVVGFFILAGAVNTSLVGANGVLARVAEDGLLPAWLLTPHPKYGTTSRAFGVIAGAQIGVILLSRGNILLLGEAYAFGVVWSFVLKSLGMVILRFRDHRPRPYRVPLNVTLGGRHVPVGIILIFLILLTAATMNFFTKEVATVSGLVFTAGLLAVLSASEWYGRRGRGGRDAVKYVEQFNAEPVENPTRESLGIAASRVVVVEIADPDRADGLREAVAAADVGKTEVVAVIARDGKPGSGLTDRERKLLTAAIDVSEAEGKAVRLLAVEAGDAAEAGRAVAAALRADDEVGG